MSQRLPALRGYGLLLALATLNGCTAKTSQLSLSALHAPPAANYEVIGQASAERSYTRVGGGAEMTRQVFADLQQQALASHTGADILVDYVVSSRMTAFPYLYLPLVSFTTFRLEGTALRMRELGRQQFLDAPPPPPEPAPPRRRGR